MPKRIAMYRWSLPDPIRKGKRFNRRHAMTEEEAAKRHPDRIRLDATLEWREVPGDDEPTFGEGYFKQ